MASSKDFVQYIVDQCSGAGDIVAKKMFGDYGIYCNGKIFGLICDDCFYLKPTEAVRPLLRTEELRPPYEGAKQYFYIADVDDHDYLSKLVIETCKVLLNPSKRERSIFHLSKLNQLWISRKSSSRDGWRTRYRQVHRR